MSVDKYRMIDWMQSLKRFGMHPGLGRTQAVLSALGHPEQGLRFLHVAGTNGKGSVCAFLTALLSVHHRVGTFTSPAFDGYRGRFVVNGRQMSESEFVALASQVRDVCEQVTPEDPLTEFEVLTVMAILYFKHAHVDVVVWETGLGGRYDSTNVVTPLVTGITNVSLDHMDVLGDTVRQIAYDKAGIIKAGVPLVTGARGEALVVIRDVAADVGAPVHVRGRDFVEIPVNPTQSLMHYRGLYRDVWAVPLGLYGVHQMENAAVALAMYEVACELGGYQTLSDTAIRQVMAAVRWPGRFETFEHNGKVVILDGAHNAEGVQRMVQSLRQFSTAHGIPPTDWTMVIGILNDKAADAMLRSALPYARKVIVTAPTVSRARNPESLAELIRSERRDVELDVIGSVEDAIRIALAEKYPVCCWGSLYTVHEARKAMKQSEEFTM
ncbi:bifunctional folylpolyglutamate synthase/dihydrofolate synthase [Alicyclobacillus pomorum]|uniref:bifunctional folylpolyglutamate synthase/dihydrofolate synthase n=1 Tax=Alicyclobacillus pomorum TaxID=204470 RepID=UPI00041684E1|nr:folylpolyglutamate synthase/dihydrofolate synthase family protein [Alicyclobacillus pomorum]